MTQSYGTPFPYKEQIILTLPKYPLLMRADDLGVEGMGFDIYNTKKLFHWWNLFLFVWCTFFSIGNFEWTLSESIAPRDGCESGLGGGGRGDPCSCAL